MQKRIKLTIDDTLSFYNDYLGDYTFNENKVQTNSYFIKVSLNWLENGTLRPAGLEKFYNYLYGETWRMGNGDGSRYLPLDARVEFLDDDQKDQWISRDYCYSMESDGLVSQISNTGF